MMTDEIRLCLCGTRSPDTDLDQEIRIAEQAGFSSVQLWVPKLDGYLATYPLVWLDTRLRSHHVYVLALRGPEPLPVLLSAGQPADVQSDYLAFQAHFVTVCAHLDALGGGIVVVEPDVVPHSTTHTGRLSSLALRRLGALADLAAPFDARIALGSPGNAPETVDSLRARWDLVTRIDRASVGLTLSASRLPQGASRAKEIEAIDVHKLWLVHLDAGEGQVGRAAGDAETAHSSLSARAGEICRRLAARGFRGPYSIELPADQPLSMPAAAAARQAIDRLLSRLYGQSTSR